MLERETEKWLSLYWRSGTGRGPRALEQTMNFIQNNARGFIRPQQGDNFVLESIGKSADIS